MSADRGVVIRLASGSEYGLRNAEEARRVYPNAEIVRFQDGAPFEEEEGDTGVNLNSMSRGELNDYATKLGVPDAEGLPNMDAVKEAIEVFQAAGGDGGTEQTPTGGEVPTGSTETGDATSSGEAGQAES